MTALLALFGGDDPGAAAGPAWAGWTGASAGGVGVTSSRGTAWAALDLPPGTYAALCFAPFGTGRLHVLDGMIEIFTVGDAAALPAASPATPTP